MSDQKLQSMFITNNENKILKQRISALIGFSKELKFLVGFFYFSGIRELYEAVKNNPNLKLYVLVGLNVDKTNYGLIEYGHTGKVDENKHQYHFKADSKSWDFHKKPTIVPNNGSNKSRIFQPVYADSKG